MTKRSIRSSSLYDPVGPFSHAVRLGSLLFISGTASVDKAGNVTSKGDVQSQTRQVFEYFKTILAEQEASLDDIVKMTVFLVDKGHYPLMNQVRAQYFRQDFPASTAVVVKELVIDGLLVEIEAIAEVEDHV